MHACGELQTYANKMAFMRLLRGGTVSVWRTGETVRYRRQMQRWWDRILQLKPYRDKPITNDVKAHGLGRTVMLERS